MGAEIWPELCLPNSMSWLRTAISLEEEKPFVKIVCLERHLLEISLSGKGILFKNKRQHSQVLKRGLVVE